MRQLIFAFCAVAAISCSAVKKVIQKKEAHSSSSQKSSSISVNKVDSTGKGSIFETETKSIDSGFIKTTVVKEFFSDEFDFMSASTEAHQAEGDSNISVIPSSISNCPESAKTGKLRYRETTTTERGQVKKVEEKMQATEQAVHMQAEVQNVKKNTATKNSELTVKDKNKSAFRFLPGLAVFLFVLLLILFIYSKLEKSSIWQILKRVTGL